MVLNTTTEGKTPGGLTVQCASAGSFRNHPELVGHITTTPIAAYEARTPSSPSFLPPSFIPCPTRTLPRLPVTRGHTARGRSHTIDERSTSSPMHFLLV